MEILYHVLYLVNITANGTQMQVGKNGDDASLPDGKVVAEVLSESDSIPLYTALTVIM